VGTLEELDSEKRTVSLKEVTSFGTEEREDDQQGFLMKFERVDFKSFSEDVIKELEVIDEDES